jgi:hypothetical protein
MEWFCEIIEIVCVCVCVCVCVSGGETKKGFVYL